MIAHDMLQALIQMFVQFFIPGDIRILEFLWGTFLHFSPKTPGVKNPVMTLLGYWWRKRSELWSQFKQRCTWECVNTVLQGQESDASIIACVSFGFLNDYYSAMAEAN